eukprot:1576351-Prymnesium_polylepis.1
MRVTAPPRGAKEAEGTPSHSRKSAQPSCDLSRRYCRRLLDTAEQRQSVSMADGPCRKRRCVRESVRARLRACGASARA